MMPAIIQPSRKLWIPPWRRINQGLKTFGGGLLTANQFSAALRVGQAAYCCGICCDTYHTIKPRVQIDISGVNTICSPCPGFYTSDGSGLVPKFLSVLVDGTYIIEHDPMDSTNGLINEGIVSKGGVGNYIPAVDALVLETWSATFVDPYFECDALYVYGDSHYDGISISYTCNCNFPHATTGKPRIDLIQVKAHDCQAGGYCNPSTYTLFNYAHGMGGTTYYHTDTVPNGGDDGSGNDCHSAGTPTVSGTVTATDLPA